MRRAAIYPRGVFFRVKVEGKTIGEIWYYKGAPEPWLWVKNKFRAHWGETGTLRSALKELMDECKVEINQDEEEILLNAANAVALHYGWMFQTMKPFSESAPTGFLPD